MKNVVLILLLFIQGGVNANIRVPRMVNIINFVRQTEPRYAEVTDEVLFNTTMAEIELLKKYELKGTFLLQYDALIDTLYQNLFKDPSNASFEIGAWWEITQPHVEACGMKWRGEYSWDWRANVGFSTGYTPCERKKLVDEYMGRFKEIFGRYPSSVGSWFIDAHTLLYMYEKYHVVALCICKEQIGTDGYTLWGGYWNQAYYPSRLNAFMPAQTERLQIDVPIFRMLGSDPIYQYDCGRGTFNQPVVSMEPVYKDSGGSKEWVSWFLKILTDNPCLAFSYVQVGQENSFSWNKIKEGLSMQIGLIDSLRKEGKLQVQTLSESAFWFKRHFKHTPATAVVALDDYRGSGMKTVWYDSRFYRVNMLWKNGMGYFRDIHLFDENLSSPYLYKPNTSSKCVYNTLPFVDGHLWSTSDFNSGMYFVQFQCSGKTDVLKGDDVKVEEVSDNLSVKWDLDGYDAKVSILFTESTMEIRLVSEKQFDWALEQRVALKKELPFKMISKDQIWAVSDGHIFEVECKIGKFISLKDSDDGRYGVFRVLPENNCIILDFK
ncbi:hypothetical protein [Bacteroides stercoris]|jgi:hypothetical protein|uniref:Uncharacterized protein n=1 Tax=Bacteroides stercoris TaxID=46506 RepID=A0A412DGZ3_BACSE|nr:hypothetical protein [Bacteroides stercoris]MDC2315581.1 hypothetical protein [Bacteroides stercoris]MDC2318713.1 hypothetical protein [Bacteroides stercoris]MDC2321876.1 hypothetical protein [Bacteroides stercoris]MDC2324930.1 hypothetical protein [Bacteroides stercoris]MDC2328085.1 hypothetical protein [Bacteroides stercoris]